VASPLNAAHQNLPFSPNRTLPFKANAINQAWKKSVSITARSSGTTEIVHVGGRYAVHGHSRSLMLMPSKTHMW